MDSQAVGNVCSKMTLGCVVVLVSGRPMIINSVISDSDAFIAAWLPGSEGGAGIVDLILNSTYDFTGKLPVTWPADMAQIPINVGDADYSPLFAYGDGCTKNVDCAGP